ncbi:15663_t:CDS:2 [Funneliformis caledonium]|uniref:15663_t:CDS:1 n=1 Tax=Funneliformis caledonium TaxID=1117310 RepID=A0A9N9F7E4_9GLOM|nr:15663_t:CDS:2 [Funneliformis caledonium]
MKRYMFIILLFSLFLLNDLLNGLPILPNEHLRLRQDFMKHHEKFNKRRFGENHPPSTGTTESDDTFVPSAPE